MSFGFDPNILLNSGGPTLNDTLRSLSDMLQQRQQMAAQQQQMAIQRAQEQRTLADLTRQQTQRQTLADIFRRNSTNPDAVAPALMARGFGPEAMDWMEKQATVSRTKTAAQEAAERLLEIHRDMVRNQVAAAKTPEAYAQILGRLSPDYRAQIGMPETYEPNAVAAWVKSGIPVEKQPAYDEQTRRATAMADPNSVTSSVRTQLAKQLGLNVPAGAPGNALDDKELELGERAQASKERQAAARLMMGAGAAGLPEEVLRSAAMRYHATGDMPQLGRDPGGLMHAAILSKAAEMFPGDNVVANKADFAANSNALKEMTNREATTGAFEATAEKNLDNFVKAAEKVPDYGSQPVNALVRTIAEKGGSPAMTAFRAAHEAAASEASKVLSGALGAGAVSDSGRHAAEMMLNPNATLEQLKSAAATLKQDMGARKKANTEAIEGLKAKVGGRPVMQSAEPAQVTSEADYNALPSGAVYVGPDGKRRRKL
jgi:hypothetical protein